jgi:lambda family phage minor tail protein L
MQAWSAAAILEKNKLSSDAPFLVLVEMEHSSLEVPVRLVRNIDSVIWDGKEWTPFPVDFDVINEDGKEVPSLTLKISNVHGIIQTYIQRYNGFVDSKIKIMVVHANHLDNPVPEVELDYLVRQTKYDEQWITFTLGASSEMVYRFPMWKYMTNYCPFRYKSIKCGYAGNLPECNNTLEQCRIPKRFGGEPGIQTGGR